MRIEFILAGIFLLVVFLSALISGLHRLYQDRKFRKDWEKSRTWKDVEE